MDTKTAEKPLEQRIPRSLKGRKARAFWRLLAPSMHASGTLTPLTEPILMGACLQFAVWAEAPHRINWAQVATVRSALRPLGVSI